MITQKELAAKAQDLYGDVDTLVDLIRDAVEEMTPVHVVETAKEAIDAVSGNGD